MSDKKVTPPVSVTADVFQKWRSARRGSANPQRMNNPLWEWLIECRFSAYAANKALNGPTSIDADPMWCFDRFGQSVTALPNGRSVLIGGEHEAYYDSDFYIYNDVVVITDGGGTEIYGYPEYIFPPTDFHSASLTGDRIVLIGSLGYPDDRLIGETQVLVLELDTWSVSRIDTTGSSPGWIHHHNAELRDASILVTGGLVCRDDARSLVENIDDWLLHLDDWRWERLTNRRWIRFELYRQDRQIYNLWELRRALWSKERGMPDAESLERRLRTHLGLEGPPRFDVIPLLYSPSVPHEALPKDPAKYKEYSIRVDGVMVRYVEDFYTVQLTIEGELPAELIECMRLELSERLETLEQSPIVCHQIPA